MGRPEKGRGDAGDRGPGKSAAGGGRRERVVPRLPADPGGAAAPRPPLPPSRPPPLSLGARFPNWEGNGPGMGLGGGGRVGRAGSPEDPGRALGRRSAVLATPRGG